MSRRKRRGRMHTANWVGLSMMVAAVLVVAYVIAARQIRVEVPPGHQGVLFKKSLLSWVISPSVQVVRPQIHEIAEGTEAFSLPAQGTKSLEYDLTLEGDWKNWVPFASGRKPQVVHGTLTVGLEKFPLEEQIRRKGDPQVEGLWLEKLSAALSKHGKEFSDTKTFQSHVAASFKAVMNDELGIPVTELTIESLHPQEGENVRRIGRLFEKLPIMEHVPFGALLRYALYVSLVAFGTLLLLYLIGGAAVGFGEVLVGVTGLPVAPFAGFTNACFGTEIPFWDFSPVGEALGAVGDALGGLDLDIDL